MGQAILVVVACLALVPGAGVADSVVATRTLRAQTIIAAADVEVVADDLGGALGGTAEAVGQETKVAIFQGRPVRAEDLRQPALIDRNQTVTLIYSRGPLIIITDGRALGRGGVGERVKAMNLESRTTVQGTVTPDGQLRVN